MLRADRLAKDLSVSRGSFYWHFPDVSAFERAVLDRWELIAVDLPYAKATGAKMHDACEALRSLLVAVFTAPVSLERVVRSWATSSDVAAEAVARVDERRLSLLKDLVTRSDVLVGRADADAVVLYCAYLGHVATNGALMNEAVLREMLERFCLEPSAPIQSGQ